MIEITIINKYSLPPEKIIFYISKYDFNVAKTVCAVIKAIIKMAENNLKGGY